MTSNFNLQPEHPDFERKTGDTREFDGRTYKFGQNQYSAFWLAGPKDGRVSCSRDYPRGSPNPYMSSRGTTCKTFEEAAKASKSQAKAEYERALDVVRRYEAEEKGNG